MHTCIYLLQICRAGFTCWGPWANNLIGALPCPFPSLPSPFLSKGVIPGKYFEILDACGWVCRWVVLALGVPLLWGPWPGCSPFSPLGNPGLQICDVSLLVGVHTICKEKFCFSHGCIVYALKCVQSVCPHGIPEPRTCPIFTKFLCVLWPMLGAFPAALRLTKGPHRGRSLLSTIALLEENTDNDKDKLLPRKTCNVGLYLCNYVIFTISSYRRKPLFSSWSQELKIA